MAETPRKVQQRDSGADETGEPCDYMIWPERNLSEEEISEIDTAVHEIAGSDSAMKQVRATSLRPPHLMFWLGPLTERQASEIRKLDRVREAPEHSFLLL